MNTNEDQLIGFGDDKSDDEHSNEKHDDDNYVTTITEFKSKNDEIEYQLHKIDAPKYKRHAELIDSAPPIEQYITSKFPSYLIPQIDNVIATATIGCSINRSEAAKYLPNCDWTPPILFLRLNSPHATCWIHGTGTIQITSVSSEWLALRAIRCVARKLKRIGYPVSFGGFSVKCLHATGCTHCEINLTTLANNHPEVDLYSWSDIIRLLTMQQREMPLLVYYSWSFEKSVAKVYRTGKIKLLGVKGGRKELYKMWCSLIPSLEKHYTGRKKVCNCEKKKEKEWKRKREEEEEDDNDMEQYIDKK